MNTAYFFRNCTALTLFAIVPAIAHAEDTLEPRVEIGVRAGTERSILTTEFWAPLAQKDGKVVYTDLRLMGDDQSDREGNLGIGYRQLLPKYNNILGAHAWIDQRRTTNNSTFHQVTLGVESLGADIDARLNGYIPLEEGRTITTGPAGSANPFLAGNGIFYNTNGAFEERPLYGVDAEMGYRLPVFERQLDSVRLYGGGYSFFRSGSDSVTGFRTRLETNITSDVSIGARYQHDNANGGQAFLDATIRFPFKSKKSFRNDGVYSRMDESPQRDVDIVTSSKVTAVSTTQQVVNAETGQAQRVIYVDNSAPAGGDGSKEHPFNSLADAQTAMQAHDIIYVNRGDGTSTNMDQGITINQPDVQLIGSGTNFVFDNGRLSASGRNLNGLVIAAATEAPLITNTQTSTDNYTGNAVFVTAGNVNIAGINASNAQGSGIYVYGNGGASMGTISISNVTATNNVNFGIGIEATDAGTTSSNITIRNSNLSSNGALGTKIIAEQGAYIGPVNFSGNTVSGNTGDNVYIESTDTGSVIDSLNFSRNAISSSSNGIYLYVIDGGQIGDITSGYNTFSSNVNGIGLNASNTSQFGNFITNHDTFTGNTGNGLNLNIQSSTIGNITLANDNLSANNNGITSSINTSTAGNILLYNTVVNDNTSEGMYFNSSDSVIGNYTFDHVSSQNNISPAIYINSNNDTVGNLSFVNVVSSNNHNEGMALNFNNGTLGDIVIVNSAIENNTGGPGFYMSANSQVIGNLTVSNLIMNNNQYEGFEVSNSSTTMGDISIDHSVFNGTTSGQGLYISNSNSGTMGNIDISNVSINANRYGGIQFSNNGTMGNVTMDHVTVDNNLSMGISISNQSNAVMQNLVMSNMEVLSNNNGGINLSNQASTIGDFTISNLNASGNHGTNVYISSQSSSTIGNAIFNNITASSSTNDGFDFYNDSSTMGNLTVSNIVTDMNNSNGTYLANTNNATVGNVNIYNIEANSNSNTGLYFVNAGTAGDVSVHDVSATYNQGGVQISENTFGPPVTTGNITLNNINTSHSTFDGLNMSLAGNATSVNVSNILSSYSGEGLDIQINGLTSSGDISFSNITANNNAQPGFNINFNNNATIHDLILQNISVSNNTNVGLNLQMNNMTGHDVLISGIISTGNYNPGVTLNANSSTLNDIKVTGTNNISNNGNHGFDLFVGNGTMHDLVVDGLVANDNRNSGLNVQLNSETVNDLSITNITANNSLLTSGVNVSLNGTAAHDILLDHITANNSGASGIQLRSEGVDALTLTNIVTDNNRQYGIQWQNYSNTTSNSMTLSGIESNNNRRVGMEVDHYGNGTVLNFSLTDSTFNNNLQGDGFIMNFSNGYQITGGQFTNVAANYNGGNGVYFNLSNGSSVMDNMNFSNIAASRNFSNGFLVATFGSASVSNDQFTGITANYNGNSGISLQSGGGSIFDQDSISSSDAIGNASYGFNMDGQFASTFNVDMGGGAMNSVGLNRSFGNLNRDVDYTAGSTLAAQHNWWGNSNGLLPSRVQVYSGTVDSSGYLTTDPRP